MEIDSTVAYPLVKQGVETAISLMKVEYSRWRQDKIAKKEAFKESNKKLRIAVSSSIVLMENAMMQVGNRRIYNARTLAENVSKIAYEVDRAAEECRGVLKKEVCDATKNLSRSFSKWQTELNPYKLRSSDGKMNGNTAIPADMRFRSYTPGEMLDILNRFYGNLEDLE